MTEHCEFSIIIPAYNAAAHLPQTLSSIAASNFPDYEVIVVDDCSSDPTADICRNFNVTLLSLAENSGAAIARNRGATIARGTYLFFIDADVRIFPDTLSKLKGAFEGNFRPDAVVGAYTIEQPVDSFYSHFQNFFTFFNHDRCNKDIEVAPITWFWTACGAIRKDIFLLLDGFREVYKGASAEDMDLGYRLVEGGYTTILDKGIEVEHSHHHTFQSIIRNNYKKAAAWGELHLRKNKDGNYSHGFTSWRNYASLLLVAFLPVSFFLALFWTDLIVMTSGAALLLVLINFTFYKLMYVHRGLNFTIRATGFHLIALFATGIGGIAAISRLFRGVEGDAPL